MTLRLLLDLGPIDSGCPGVQVVLGSLKQQPCAPGQTFQKRTVVKALDYFGVPISLWPQGFQLMQRAETKLRATAEDIIKQISALAATSHKPYGTDNGGTIQFCSQYSASQVNEDAGTYTIVEHSGHSGISLSERVRKAVVELGRADHLDITFEDHSRSRKYNYEYHYMVVKVYVSR